MEDAELNSCSKLHFINTQHIEAGKQKLVSHEEIGSTPQYYCRISVPSHTQRLVCMNGTLVRSSRREEVDAALRGRSAGSGWRTGPLRGYTLSEGTRFPVVSSCMHLHVHAETGHSLWSLQERGHTVPNPILGISASP